MIKVSVVFATHNGAATLPRLLAGYSRQECDKSAWELIVVDNGSKDSTAEILDSFADRLPITRLYCPHPGKNLALNRALDTVALGAELFVVTDDDSVPAPGFLAAWIEVAAREDRRRLYGGIVHPTFLEEPPSHVWDFRSHFAEIFAENVGKAEFRAEDIYGPNMAVPGWVFRAGARFNERIGPNAANPQYPMGSETEFCRRISREFGLKATFVPEAIVEHLVKNHQTTMGFIKGRAFRHGRGFAMQQELERGRAAVILSALRPPPSEPCPRWSAAETIWVEEWRRGFRSHAFRFARSADPAWTPPVGLPVRPDLEPSSQLDPT